MITKGEYTSNNITYGVLLSHSKVSTEVILIDAGVIVSAYKMDITGSYSFNNVKAKEFAKLIQIGAKGCTAKNCTPVPFELGACNLHEFNKAKVSYAVYMFRGEIVGAYIQSDSKRIEMHYQAELQMPSGIEYVKLTEVKDNVEYADSDLDAVPVRTVSEIALEKDDVSWLKNKKYYIVNDDKTAEEIFQFIEGYNGIVSYDTETTGLNINCFGKIGSSYMRDLAEYNKQHPDDQIRADRLVGIIFCIEKDISYYFPCFNRKFDNLYQNKDSKYRRQIISNTKARYSVGDLRNRDEDMKRYVLNTPEDEWDLGVILMERVRNILEKCHLVAHHGSFEYAVGLQYGIDTNIKDDTMLMHQLMYKFRSTTRNSGEPSNLKYLAKRELGIDQWELTDFFPSFKEDTTGTVRTKSKEKKTKSKKKRKVSVKIDFSYMDYEGTKVYAPTDGDVTLQLCFLYKQDMLQNYPKLQYLYSVEVLVSMAIGYMEFYGHRIDESKINEAKNLTMAKIVMLESEFRQLIEYSNDEEVAMYKELKAHIESLDKLEKTNKLKYNFEIDNIPQMCEKLREVIDNNVEHQINLSAPGQVADLFYNKLGYPMQGDKPSVAKKELKALIKEKADDGSPKYPAAVIYSDYKKEDTLQTKFFDNLGTFMYPGGFIFSHFGQIAAATGRMSCIEENSLISLKLGHRPIKDINAGDEVWCYTDEGKLTLSKVLQLIYKGRKKCLELTFYGDKDENNCRELKTLKCTPDHRIRLTNGKWKQACNLQLGDRVSGSIALGGIDLGNIDGKDYAKVVEYEFRGARGIKEHAVYDLEIENHHNFIASGICVHNCSKPNAQQYPKVISKIVIPRDGFIMLDADYSQIEYRVLTALAKNEYLAEMFADPDSDYHTLMASLMYGVPYASVTPSMRSSAKSFNFGIPYGMGFKSLAILLTGNSKPESVDEAKEKYELYFKNQPKTRVFFDSVKEQAQVNGYTKTLFERRRDYQFVDKDGNINNAKKAAALRQAGNSIIQGCLDGNTLIQTKEFGIVKIKDVVNNHLNVWDGDKWSEGDILYSGKKRKCIVRFTNGQEFICSPTHKFLVRSAKGKDRFVECKDLITKDSGRNPHRVVVNSHYKESDYTYNSEWAYKYKTHDSNINDVFIENIGDSFKAGMVLGRLASDGCIINREVDSDILQYVTEHEKDVAKQLIEYMGPLGIDCADDEKVSRIYSYSKSLVDEVTDLDIKNSIHENIFMDTELLRGFIRGMFDSYGRISGKTITLTFGTQCDFESMCRDIQKALAFFGIRSRCYRNKIEIKANDNQSFMNTIGFMDNDKQRLGETLKCTRDEHIFNTVILPESVDITDEYIDMYDVCNTDGGYYVADGIITHNTAADVFKIGVARNFNYIRQNNLLGKVIIVNMVHDEQLIEVDVQNLNPQRILTDIGKNMQFKIEGFPPLYIGAGVGPAWGYAKDKMAEIHPVLLDILTEESNDIPIYRENNEPVDPKRVLDYFHNRVVDFRREKVKAYLSNPDNWNKSIHPAIGNLINLQFNYGRGDDAGKYRGPNGEKYTDQEFLELNIGDFIKENGIDAEPWYFKANDISTEENKDAAEKESDEYDDNDGDEVDSLDADIEIMEEDYDRTFNTLDDSNKLFGASVQDIISMFGTCILRDKRICGICTKEINHRQLDNILDFLVPYICTDADEEAYKGDPDAYQVVWLTATNILKYTGLYVKGLSNAALENAYNSIVNDTNIKKSTTTGDYSGGDIDNRSQAK